MVSGGVQEDLNLAPAELATLSFTLQGDSGTGSKSTQAPDGKPAGQPGSGSNTSLGPVQVVAGCRGVNGQLEAAFDGAIALARHKLGSEAQADMSPRAC